MDKHTIRRELTRAANRKRIAARAFIVICAAVAAAGSISLMWR